MTALTPLQALERSPWRWLVYPLAGLALAVLTLWTGAYFWLGSSVGRGQVLALARDALNAPLRIGVVRWGPAPDELVAGDIALVGPDHFTLAYLRSATLDVDLGALIGGDVAVDSLEAELDYVLAHSDADGRIDLAAALAPPRPSGAGPATPGKPKKTPEVRELRVFVREVWLDFADADAQLRDVSIKGSLRAGLTDGKEGPAIVQVSVVTGPVHAVWNRARQMTGFDECRLDMTVQGTRVALNALELARTEEVLGMSGELVLGEKPDGTFTAHGRLGPYEAAALAGNAFPLGFDFDGLELRLRDGKVAGSVGQLLAPRWSSGPFSADHVAFGVARFASEPGLLVPSLDIEVRGLAAARLEGLDWQLEGVWVPTASGDLDRKLVIDLRGWAADWVTPHGAVGPVDLAAAAQLKLTGGQLLAQVASDLGLVEAIGTLKSSPLTKRTDFVAELAFADARGALAKNLVHDLDDTQRAALGDRVSGNGEVEVEVDREDRYAPWVTTLEWAAGRLDGKTTLTWDGYAWAPTEGSLPSAGLRSSEGDPAQAPEVPPTEGSPPGLRSVTPQEQP